MRAALLLAQLNEADLAVDAPQKRLAEIADALREPAVLSTARRSLAEAESELARCETLREEREQLQQTLGAKLARSEHRLYSGQVGNPKELEDAERDVQQVRRQHSLAEDNLLDALIGADTAAEHRDAWQEKLARLTAGWEAKQVSLRGEQARIEARLPEALARQARARHAAPADLLPLYDSLRERRNGRAVTSVDGDACAVCGVAIPQGKLEMALYGDELVYCGNCGRLIWGE